MTDRRTADGTDVRDRIARYLDDTGLSDRTARVVPLTGDASDRRYFRVLLRDEPSQVIAVQPGPIEFEALPFVNVARLLEAMPVPIPRILGHSNELGVMALEDLGDVTLQAHLGAAAAGEHDALYREAVSLIDAMQRRGAELMSNEYIPYRVAFDVEKLTWELQFFLKHFLEGYRGVSLSGPARAALTEDFAVIAEELAGEPRVLCHRDYHSRNLMLHQGRLYIIDFQDARMGPDTYDLVSLLRDSYVDFTEAQVDQLIALFVALRVGRTLPNPPGEPDPGVPPALARGGGAARPTDADFRRRFDLMSVQRNLKALGTFGFQTIRRANTVYIQYMPRTLRYVRANLDRYPRFARLREILAEHLEELR
jgi:aminoglycoside/choline kinase family phosphotransferase